MASRKRADMEVRPYNFYIWAGVEYLTLCVTHRSHPTQYRVFVE